MISRRSSPWVARSVCEFGRRVWGPGRVRPRHRRRCPLRADRPSRPSTRVTTPGHTPGHVSYLRPSDGVLVTGDVLITLRINSLSGLLFGRRGLSGPPWYTTWDRRSPRTPSPRSPDFDRPSTRRVTAYRLFPEADIPGWLRMPGCGRLVTPACRRDAGPTGPDRAEWRFRMRPPDAPHRIRPRGRDIDPCRPVGRRPDRVRRRRALQSGRPRRDVRAHGSAIELRSR